MISITATCAFDQWWGALKAHTHMVWYVMLQHTGINTGDLGWVGLSGPEKRTWRLRSGHSRYTREPSGWTKAAIHPLKHHSKDQQASSLTRGGTEELSLNCTLHIPWVRVSTGCLLAFDKFSRYA